MLPFLREQGLENLTPQKRAANAGRGDREAPENAQGQEYLTVAARSKNVRKSTIMVAVLFCVGLVGLWFMIKKSKPEGASAAPVGEEETKIEVAISRLTGVSSEMLSRMDQIVKKFYEFSNVLQVRVDELTKNPFEFELFLSNLRSKTVAEQPKVEEDINAKTILRQEQLRQQASSLRLLSVMKSPQSNCCMINDKILQEGEVIRGFKVTQIGDSSVDLVWDAEHGSAPAGTESQEFKIVLKLSQ
jgi:hypothetical protein